MAVQEAGQLWWTRIESGQGRDRIVTMCGYDSAEHEPGTILTEPVIATPWLRAEGVAPSGSPVRHLSVATGPAAAPLWWVTAPETTANPPAMTLVAFDCPGPPPGSVLDPAGQRSAGAASNQQVGAARWFPSTGRVHQLYVAPHRRRQGLGTALLFAVAGYCRLCGWPVPWGSGQRTDLGDALLTRGHPIFGQRIEELTHRLLPMTPPEQQAGVPRRNLEPDD